LFQQEFQLLREIKDLSSEEKKKYLEAAFGFIRLTCNELKLRLPWKDIHTPSEPSCLLLSQSFLLQKHIPMLEHRLNLHQLANRFNNIITPDVFHAFEDELNALNLDNENIRQEIKQTTKRKYLEAWQKFQSNFPLLYKLITAVEAISYSSASVERLFSTMKDIITLKRNRLTLDNLESCLLLKQEFHEKDDYFTAEMYNLYYESLIEQLHKNSEAQNEQDPITKSIAPDFIDCSQPLKQFKFNDSMHNTRLFIYISLNRGLMRIYLKCKL